jgi:hypothetical protein
MNERRKEKSGADHPAHEEDFAEGQATTERHPEEDRGDFAEGQEHGRHDHEGEFGSGQENAEKHPEHKKHGDFARGQERKSNET